MIVALVVAFAFFMETFTGTVITTALPEMARAFGSTPVELSLGITAYMISLAVFIPISGWVVDKYGSRTIFRAAIGLFTLASILCGISNNLGEFASARILQGIGGAMMVPVGRLVVLRSVDKADLVRAMAYVTVPGFIGPVLGPPIGGFITTYVSWRWIFFLNIPIGLLGMVLVTFLIENQREAHTPKLDWIGFTLTGLSLSCLVYSLDLLAQAVGGQPLRLLGILGLGLASGFLAVAHARRHPHPLIDLSLLEIPTFSVAIWGGLLFRLGAGAMPFLLPVMLQVGFGLSAFASGLLTFADAIGSVTMNALAPPVLRRLGFRRVLVGNVFASAACIFGCSLFTATTPTVAILLALFVGGFIKSLQYNSMSAIVFADIPPARMSAATSLSSTVQQLGNGMGVAVGAVLLQLVLVWHGGAATLTAGDIRIVIGIVALLAALSVLFFSRLTAGAGAEVSGHRRPPRG